MKTILEFLSFIELIVGWNLETQIIHDALNGKMSLGEPSWTAITFILLAAIMYNALSRVKEGL